MAATIRNYGYTNPEAVMYGKPQITIADVLASRMVASPFHLLDLCVSAEGGGAVVLTSVERARDLKQPAVAVLGGGMQFHEAPYKNPRSTGPSVASAPPPLPGCSPNLVCRSRTSM